MPPLLDCPEIDCWQLLLDETAPSDQRERYERHLETCPACQERLDQAEAPEDTLRRRGRRVGDPTIAPSSRHWFRSWSVCARLHRPCGARRGSQPTCISYALPGRRTYSALLARYEVHEVIGQGGMGVVLKAFEPALQRLVAIKVLSAAVAGSVTARRRFTREAQAAAAVCHEHIVAVHGVHEADGLPYLVMQYVAGESLQTRLDRSGPLQVGGSRPHRPADRHGAGRRARPRADPPGHQAGQHPAGRRAGSLGDRRDPGQDHRFRPGTHGR